MAKAENHFQGQEECLLRLSNLFTHSEPLHGFYLPNQVQKCKMSDQKETGYLNEATSLLSILISR